ncbi:hypothetical protein N0V84_005521 [Fusarium piperis]|uniref:Aminoglycoside phosphotransferase domain-containing protein n=1 Tax=Fusarium piperis TaxID=1435070 RepID=A0A9W9BP56_9HYPO|nr:hypothetical protein N0V84_005521 [Fusarium piperis]
MSLFIVTEPQADYDRPVDIPPPEEEIEEQIEAFISSITDEAICCLASRFQGGRSCTITGRSRGSFNICFFVRFDNDIEWTVRVPLEPVVHDVWAKLQSEVATIRYLERKTTIPVPRICEYGKAELFPGGPQAFIIYEYISGQPLKMDTLANASEADRNHLYGDLIDILAQLHSLKFPTSGSLMPGPNETEPVVDAILSMSANELHRSYPKQRNVTGDFKSSGQYLKYQCDLLRQSCRLPMIGLSKMAAQRELFAFESVRQRLQDLPRSHGPFVLAHQDLRYSNILTDGFRIKGIIDWEFAAVIPEYLFTPPSWLTGHDIEAVARYGYSSLIPHETLYTEFLRTLDVKSRSSDQCADLKRNWEHQPEFALPIAQILRDHSRLDYVYFKFIFPKLSNGDIDDEVGEFFDKCDDTLKRQIQKRLEWSKVYAQHFGE